MTRERKEIFLLITFYAVPALLILGIVALVGISFIGSRISKYGDLSLGKGDIKVTTQEKTTENTYLRTISSKDHKINVALYFDSPTWELESQEEFLPTEIDVRFKDPAPENLLRVLISPATIETDYQLGVELLEERVRDAQSKYTCDKSLSVKTLEKTSKEYLLSAGPFDCFLESKRISSGEFIIRGFTNGRATSALFYSSGKLDTTGTTKALLKRAHFSE